MSPLRSRFSAKYAVDETTGCWNWTACLSTAGYGKIGDGRKSLLAHRVSWELVNGPIEHGMFVCHRCDNPRCVNPAHLFIGTQVDNIRDAMKKGRHKKPPTGGGELCSRAKLTADQARTIRFAPGSLSDVARTYRVPISTAFNIRNGKTWRSL